jgi:periplasmic divalent cation tolerance protein
MMFVAWTTLPTKDEAERLAADAVKHNLAVCVQIDGPISSHYVWNGKQERTEEFRLTFKCVAASLPALETFVLSRHPYDTPEWIAVRAEHVGEKYLSWAESRTSTQPL